MLMLDAFGPIAMVRRSRSEIGDAATAASQTHHAFICARGGVGTWQPASERARGRRELRVIIVLPSDADACHQNIGKGYRASL